MNSAAVKSNRSTEGNNFNVLTRFTMISTIFPYVGLIVNRIEDIEQIRVNTTLGDYYFVGTWEKVKEGYKLTDVNYQNNKTGDVKTKEQIVNMLIF